MSPIQPGVMPDLPPPFPCCPFEEECNLHVFNGERLTNGRIVARCTTHDRPLHVGMVLGFFLQKLLAVERGFGARLESLREHVDAAVTTMMEGGDPIDVRVARLEEFFGMEPNDGPQAQEIERRVRERAAQVAPDAEPGTEG
jgi:hypothetical protein